MGPTPLTEVSLTPLRGLSFGAPWVLLLLFLLPVWWVWRSRRAAPAAITFSRVATLAAGPAAGQRIARTLFVLRNLALAGAVVALAQPRLGARAETVTSQGINIVLAVDLSSSMLALDFQPENRLEVAKATMRHFVAGRTADRIGVVAFASEALTQVPLTLDYPVVQAAIDNLQSGQLEDGTAIGTAIATAANRLRSAPGSRVMILLTDGVNNRGVIDPRTAAKAAAAYGIRIYTIGIGSEGMAPVPVGRGLFGLRYENRQVEIDAALLTDVARITNGRFFRARDADALADIYRQIDDLERVPVHTQVYVRWTDLFRWPLGLALIALTLELALFAWRGPLT